MSAFAPEFLGVEKIDGTRYLKMQNFLLAFDQPSLCQMDVKMGVRCFAESELSSTTPRADLYERLRKMDASELTADEVAKGSITKSRWMKLRDSLSSTNSLGFRVDGILTPTVRREAFGDLATVREEAEVLAALRSFLQCGGPHVARKACCDLLVRLASLEAALRRSSLFWQSEIIGSSLVLAVDGTGRCGVWMLDFGLTRDAPHAPLMHDAQWELGNHEDGYLLGLSNLQRLWGRLLEEDVWPA